MGRNSLLLTLALLLIFSFGIANSQSSIHVTNVTGAAGLFPNDTILTGVQVQWTIAWRNLSGGTLVGSNNGFTVHDNGTGSEWPIPVLDTLDIAPTSGFGWKARYDNVFIFYHAGNNGGVGARNADTMGIGGFNIFSPGFPDGFDYDVMTITLPAPGIDVSHHGKSICLDSSKYDPNSNNEWIWSSTSGAVIPAWAGPHCYAIVDPNAPTTANLIIEPDSLGFTAVEGGSNPSPKPFNITSDGSALDFTLTKDSAWLSTDISGGTTPSTALVNIDISGLAPGNYRDTIVVTSAAADNSPRFVVVTLDISPATKFLETSPDTLMFNAVEGSANPASQKFAVTETGGFGIAYTLAESSAWFTLDKAGGTTPDSVGVNVDISLLSPGNYLDSVTVASAEADNSPIYEYVWLEVAAADKFLDVDPDTLYFSAIESGANPAVQYFDITETGGFNIPFNLTENSIWFSLTKASGTTSDSVGVNVDITGFTEGTYLDSVQVTSGDANNSPIYEYIWLEVTGISYFLDVTVDTLTFTAQEGGADPATQNFGVIETGAANISYEVAETTDWFSLNKSGGTTPDVVTVSAFVGSLTEATYYDDITVSSIEADNPPLTVTVKFVITGIPAKLYAMPNSIEPAVNQGGPPFAPINIFVSDSFAVGIAYEINENVDWLNISTFTGTTPDSFLVIADTAVVNSLAPGFYTDSITISSIDADNSPINVLATLEVIDVPNNPPVIDPIDDQIMDEGDHLEVSFAVGDPDSDPIFLFTGPLPSFANFVTDKSILGATFIFDPGFNDAGVYNITAYASDGKDTSGESFTLTVLDQEPGTEGDTLHIGTVPAVPGQQVTVPIDISNSCNLHGVYIPITWDGDSLIVLDSIKFNDSLVGHLTAKTVEINNDSNFALITFDVIAPDLPIPPGHALLADMYFSVSPVTPGGAYGVNPGLTSTSFYRDCGTVNEEIIPVIPGGGGNIVVDTTNVYVCGYVVDEDGVGIWGATVELWPDFPCDGPIQTTLTNGDGAYAFTDFSLGSFDLYAWKRGDDSTTWNDAYYPQNVHVNFGENGITIELQWLDEIVPSDVWVDYFCNTNTLFNCPLPVGSVVEVWDEDDVLCGRQFVREAGNYRYMPVYRDSSGSVIDEGATTGDNLRFYINGVQALANGNTIYPASYEQVEVCLDGGARLTKECFLNTGWNLVSWNLDTDNDDIEEVLSSLDGCIDVVLGFEKGGLTYVPGMDLFNTLTAVDHLSGYWIKLGDVCNHTLEISGVPVEQDTPIPVNAGWNLVSYLPDDAHSINDALYSLDGNLQIAYTYDATPLVFVPPPADSTFNTLNQMEPCFGYWLKLNNASVLTYPAANGAMPKYEWPIVQNSLSAEEKIVEPTRNWVNLYSYNLTLDGRPVSIGAEISAHNLSGKVVGHYIMKESGTFGFMPVYADQPGESITQIKPGETFYLTVDGNKTNEEFQWTLHGGLIEVAALTTGAGPGNTLPESYVLEQNYPNPFNPSTTINFSLPVASNARLEIFNLLGQVVATPFDGMAEAGEHKIVWDGRNSSGVGVASGIYLYRLTAGNFVQTRKMTLIQ